MRLVTAVVFLIVTYAGALAQTANRAPDLSKEIERRTGHGINPATKVAALAVPDGVSLDDGLSEDDAIAVALWNNRAWQAELTALGLARADLIEAGQLRNPSLTLIFPISSKLIEAVANWPFEALWQRPKRVAAARAELDRTAEILVGSALNLVRDVRLAYAEALFAQERARVAGEGVRERGEIATIVNARFRAGEISE